MQQLCASLVHCANLRATVPQSESSHDRLGVQTQTGANYCCVLGQNISSTSPVQIKLHGAWRRLATWFLSVHPRAAAAAIEAYTTELKERIIAKG